jgi:hypothetical protein
MYRNRRSVEPAIELELSINGPSNYYTISRTANRDKGYTKSNRRLVINDELERI